MTTYLRDRRTAGIPDPAEVITVTLGGKTFRAGRRTAAHIEWTIERLAAVHPEARLRVIQPPFNVGVPASKYTHDFDGVIDLEIVGLSWRDAERFMRECGWACWYRFPPTFPYHLHAVSLGCAGPVGIYVPGQVDDYYAHKSGLKGHAPDNTWHPSDIDSTIFDYPAWIEEQDVSPEQEDRIVKRVIDGLLAAQVGGEKDPATLKQAVNQIRTAVKKK